MVEKANAGGERELPSAFVKEMKELFGKLPGVSVSELPAFIESFQKERSYGLRRNPLKYTREEFEEKMPFYLERIPWAEEGYFYKKEEQPGKSPYHETGAFYMQEPSAMIAAELLSPKPGERILDLCAAPGGKSTQIAAAMRGHGVLVCNEIHPARAKILSGNAERMGVTNALVTNETPQRLAERFSGYFTRILVDAPCSGEGMFRRNEEARGEWSLSNVTLCAARQDEILDCAADMLAPGGRLLYSTCTFEPEENEGSIARFLARHPAYTVEKTKRFPGMCSGVPEWADGVCAEVERTIRLWPHRLAGEGHYLAVLKKDGAKRQEAAVLRGACGRQAGFTAHDMKSRGEAAEFMEFARDTLAAETVERFCGSRNYLRFGEQLYRFPEGMPAVEGLKVLRPGLHLGSIRKNRFEPSHALALSLQPGEALRVADFAADSAEIRRYLAGETFPFTGEKGWYLVAADGYGIGWGKLSGGVMKNHYPKGLRKV